MRLDELAKLIQDSDLSRCERCFHGDFSVQKFERIAQESADSELRAKPCLIGSFPDGVLSVLQRPHEGTRHGRSQVAVFWSARFAAIALHLAVNDPPGRRQSVAWN
jgi:hypothetical protein